MKKPHSLLLPAILFCVTLSLAVAGVFAAWIYFAANVTPLDQNVSVDMGNFYYDIAITEITPVSGTTVSSQTGSRVFPLSAQSTVTGNSGQKVVYKVTAHNYSATVTYVYTGAAGTSGSVTVASSSDSGNQNKIPVATNANYTSGHPIAPGETFTFYATYTLTNNMSAANVFVNYQFVPVVYTVTYMDNNAVYAVDCITNNGAEYTVRSDYPPVSGSNVRFEYWMNASGIKVTSYPRGNKNNYTLNAKWNNIYSIIFVDADGSVVHQEHITKETTALSAEGQAVVNEKMAQWQAAVAEKDITVKWSDYSFGTASDIIVRAEYTYSGILKLVPVYNEGGVDDGILDYYRVDPVDNLTSTNVKDGIVHIPGMIGNIPVKEVERVTNEAGSGDWNNFNDVIKEIHVGEGTEQLNHNSLSYTTALKTVYLPSTLKSMGKNTFSRNTGSDKKVLTIHFAGTKAEWDAIVNASVHEYGDDWAGGLKEGSVVVCEDGYYRCYDVKMSWFRELRFWEWHPHAYGTSCSSNCP